MKRIMLRLSALAIMVGLGWIAIAHAQRESTDSGTSQAKAADSAEAARVNSTPESGPIGATARPKLLPADPSLNPLRASARPFRTEAVTPVAATAELRPLRTPAAKDPIPPTLNEPQSSASRSAESGSVGGQPPVDPFGLRPRVAMETGKGVRATGADLPEPPRTMDTAGDSDRTPGRPPSQAADLRGPAPAPADPIRNPPTPAQSTQRSVAETRTEARTELVTTPPASSASGPEVASDRAMGLEGSRAESVPKAAPQIPSGVRASGTAPRSSPVAAPSVEPALLNPSASGAMARVPRPTVGDAPASNPRPTEPGLPDPRRVEMSRSGEGTGKPGSKQLEGPQAPQLTIQKIAPAEVQVGKPATFHIKLKNTGPVAAQNVEIRDLVPKGARLLSTTPRAQPGVHGELVWQLGMLKPGDEYTVEVQIMPLDEGELGSVATVHFGAEASARTIATKPQLVLKCSAPNTVLIGSELSLSITVSNVGSGTARQVVLEERVPPGLQHAAGPELEYEIGDLKPNESRQVELKLTAVQPGAVTNVLVARGDANLKAEDRVHLEVLAPQLEIAVEGPKRRFLEREATYQLAVSNPGTAPARHVELLAQLPTGLKFVSASNLGHYDEATRSVRWLLEELPIKETGIVELVTTPVEIGEQTLRVRGAAEKGLAVEKEHPVIIEGIAAILFEVVDTHDPIEIQGETTYEIRVKNQGSKAATNVQVAAILPSEMRAVAAEGPTQHTIDGIRVTFAPLPRLAAKADTTYRVRVQGLKAGDQRVRVQLLTDDIRNPITKEESTRVYSDE